MNIFNIFKGKSNFIRERSVFVFLFLLGLISTVILRPLATGYPYQFGSAMIGLFIPPFLTGLYLFYYFYLHTLNKVVFARAILLFFLQLIPFYPLFFQETAPYPGEDLARNMIYAKNMIVNHTLWGGDELLFDVHSKSFITQPGYRYFVALELLVFQKLYRFVSVLNLSAMVASIYIYYRLLTVAGSNDTKTKNLLALIALFTIPYATKNVLMGLSEWLTVLALVLSSYFFIAKKNVTFAVVFLALVVFLRQNLMPPVLLLTIAMLVSSRNKVRDGIVFLALILLPVYHNLYYAHEFRFFISIFNYPFLSYTDNSLPASGINFLLLFNNVAHYIGVHFKRDGSFDLIEESLLFLWLFNYSLIHVVKNVLHGSERLYFLLVMCSVILPTIALATDFYPRFEFVVVYFFLVTVPVLQNNTAIMRYAAYFSLFKKKTD